MFTGFVKGIPLEIEEAALIDGCNPLQVFFKSPDSNPEAYHYLHCNPSADVGMEWTIFCRPWYWILRNTVPFLWQYSTSAEASVMYRWDR